MSKSLNIRRAFFVFLLFAIGCQQRHRQRVTPDRLALVEMVIADDRFQDVLEQAGDRHSWLSRVREKLLAKGIVLPIPDIEAETESYIIASGDPWGRLTWEGPIIE